MLVNQIWSNFEPTIHIDHFVFLRSGERTRHNARRARLRRRLDLLVLEQEVGRLETENSVVRRVLLYVEDIYKDARLQKRGSDAHMGNFRGSEAIAGSVTKKSSDLAPS